MIKSKDIKKDFIGIWNLISFESQTVDGQIIEKLNWGGRLIYDEKGYMSAQMMDLNRKPIPEEASAEEIKDAFLGCGSYYGTYEVNIDKRIVTHHVEGSLLPNWINTDLERFFKFSNRFLELKAPLESENDTEIVYCVLWERLK